MRDNQRVKRTICWWLSIRVIPPPSAQWLRPSLAAIAQLHQAQARLALSVQYPAQRDEAKAQVLKAQADLANAQAGIAASAGSIRVPPATKH